MINSLSINDNHWIKRIGRENIDFPSRVNLLVGSNGCGKSSVLALIEGLTNKAESIKKRNQKSAQLHYKAPDGLIVYYLDTEKTLRTQSYIGDNAMTQMAMKFSSHGEAMRVYWREMTEKQDKESVFCIDEPETGLDLPGQFEFAKLIETTPHQYIIATHSPVLWGVKDASLITLGEDPSFVEDYKRKLKKALGV